MNSKSFVTVGTRFALRMAAPILLVMSLAGRTSADTLILKDGTRKEGLVSSGARAVCLQPVGGGRMEYFRPDEVREVIKAPVQVKPSAEGPAQQVRPSEPRPAERQTDSALPAIAPKPEDLSGETEPAVIRPPQPRKIDPVADRDPAPTARPGPDAPFDPAKPIEPGQADPSGSTPGPNPYAPSRGEDVKMPQFTPLQTALLVIGMLAAAVGRIMIIVNAFQNSTGKGLLCLCIDLYTFYYACVEYDAQSRLVGRLLYFGGPILVVLVAVLSQMSLG